MRIGIVLICLTLSACQTTHTRSLPNAQSSAAPFAASIQQNLDTYLAQALTADTAVSIGLLQSPDVKKIIAELNSHYQQAEIDSAWPSLNIGLKQLLQGNSANLSTSIELSFSRLLWSHYYQNIRQHQQQQALALARQQLLTYALEVRQHFYQYQNLQAQEAGLYRLQEASEALMMLAQRQQQAGNIGQRDYDHALIMHQKNVLQRADNQRQQQSLRATLNQLLGLWGQEADKWQVSTQLPVLPKQLANLVNVEQFALAHHPAWQVAEQQRLANTFQSKLNGKQRWLDGISVGAEQEDNDTSAQLGFSIPLTGSSQKRLTKAQQQAILAEQEAQTLHIRWQTRLAYQHWQSSWQTAHTWQQQLLPAYTSIRKQSALHYNGMLEGLESLIEANQQEHQAYVDFLDALMQFALSQNQLEQWLTLPIEQAAKQMETQP
jgi:cobalt-zinc-cadmium efflux system outer membrane protein